MSLSVISRVIGGDSKRFALSNEQTAIKLDPDILSGWQRLRIGMRFAIPDTGGNLTGTPLLAFGLLSNPSANCANGPLTNSCGHFVGLLTPSSTWTRSTNSWEESTTRITRRVGSTIDAETDTDGVFVPHGAATYRGGMIIEFDRSTPSLWDIDLITPGSDAECAIDISESAMIAGMEYEPGGAGISGAIGYSGGGQSHTTEQVTVDEGTDGELNALCIAWNKTSPMLEIEDVYWSVNEYA